MYQTSSLVLSAVYEGVRMIAQPESQNAVGIPAMDPGDWRSQLDRLLTEIVQKESASEVENQLLLLINSHPTVTQAEWRQALVQACDEQVPFFRASPLPRLWDRWLWDAVDKCIICRVLDEGCTSANTQEQSEQEHEWMTNGQLQTYINQRMREHSQRVCKPLRREMSDVYNEISEAIEAVWERVSLGDQKRDCLGLASMFEAVQGIVNLQHNQDSKYDTVD
ncbi:hypothetical protein RHS03_08577, partial [Rhizoctonia solani]